MALALLSSVGAFAPAAADDDWQALSERGLRAAAEADWTEAETAFRRALETLEALPREGPAPVDRVAEDDARVAAIAGNLAVALLEQGEVAEARDLLARSLAIRRAALGPSDPLIAETMGNLGELERRAGRLEQARELHAEALAMRRETLEAGHPDIALSLTNLGVTLYDMGLLREAAIELDEALAIRLERLGPAHRATLETAISRSAVALAADDLDAAGAALREPVAAIANKAMASGGTAANALRSMIEVQLAKGDADAAVLLCEDAVLEASAPAPAAGLDVPTAELLGACGRALLQVGAAERALALLERWLAYPALPAASEAELRWSLADAAAATADLETAEKALSRTIELLEANDDPRLAIAFNNRASLRFERGRPLDAVADLQTALSRLDSEETEDQRLLRDVLANYAIVLRTLDRHGEAAAAEERLIDLAAEGAPSAPAAGD